MAAPTSIDASVTFNFASQTGLDGIVRRIVTDKGPTGTVVYYYTETWQDSEPKTLMLTDQNNVQAK